jgi:hypothetical protein
VRHIEANVEEERLVLGSLAEEDAGPLDKVRVGFQEISG